LSASFGSGADARSLLRGARRRLRRGPLSGIQPAPEWDYSAWLQRRCAERAKDLEAAPPGLFSILTCIYEGSPADLFRETAASVLGQQSRDFEWIVVAQGQIPDDLLAVLRETASDLRVRCLLRPDNIGIIRGLRSALETATGAYVLPLDGDDRLLPDALGVLGAAISRRDHPLFLYGDEDALVDGEPTAPYFRPDWDPVLNHSSSYIWHPSVFDRRRALELGVFADVGSEYCQDWDTVFRFWMAGIEPEHVPEVLYSWTAHGASSTHRADPHRGSLDSQSNVLRRALAKRSLEEDFDLAAFPLDRGLPELWPRRAHRHPPDVAVVVACERVRDAARTVRRVSQSCDYPLQGFVVHCPQSLSERKRAAIAATGTDSGAARQAALDLVQVRGAGVSTLRRAVDALSSAWTVIITPDAVPDDADWLWETIGLGELVADIGFVSGRIVDGNGMVVGGGELWGAGDPVDCPDRGYGALDPGPYAISLKPHCVSAVDPRFFAARTNVLAEALADVPNDADVRWLGVWLGMWAERHRVRTACSPLVSARGARGAAATGPMTDVERQAIIRRFGSFPEAHPLVRLYRRTGGRGAS
jgi:hypothetical protein